MKKLFVFLMMAVFFTLTVNAQLSKPTTAKYVKLVGGGMTSQNELRLVIINDVDTSYQVLFRDAQYTRIIEYKHFNVKNKEDLKAFLIMVKDAISGDSKERVLVTLDGVDIIFAKEKFAGASYAKISTDGGYGYFYTKDIDKYLAALN